MAYISDYTSTVSDGDVASQDIELPNFSSGDLLLMLVSQDNGSVQLTINDNSWTELGTQNRSGYIRSAIFYKIAGATETSPTISGKNAADIGADVFAIKDFDTTTPIKDTIRVDWNNTDTINLGQSSNVSDGDLVIYSVVSDNIKFLRFQDDVVPVAFNRTGGDIQISGYRYHCSKDGTSSKQVTAYHELTTEGGNAWTIVIGKGADNRAYNIDTFPYNIIKKYSYKDTLDGVTADNFTSTILGIPLSNDLTNLTFSHTKLSSMGWFYTGKVAVGDNPTSDLWSGWMDNFGGNSINLGSQAGIIQFTVQLSSNIPKKVGAEGFVVGFKDGTGNWEAYQIFTRAKIPVNLPTTVYIDTISKYRMIENNGAVDYSNVTGIVYLIHRTGRTAYDLNLYYRDLTLPLNPVVFLGSQNNPVTPNFNNVYEGDGFFDRNSFQGVGQQLFSQGITIGDGTTQSYFNFSKSSFEIKKQGAVGCFIGADRININFNLSSNDYLDLSSSIFNAKLKEYITFLSSSSENASINTEALNIINFILTLNSGVNFDTTTFIKSQVICNTNTSTFTNCIFNDCDLSVKDLDEIVTSSFKNTSGSGYAVELEAGQGKTTFNWSSKLSGYATSDGTTGNEAIHILDTSGTITINVIGGDTPTIHSEGATVVVQNTKNFTFTLSPGITGYEWRIYQVDNVGSLAGAVELAGQENATSSSQTYTYSYVSNKTIAVQILSEPDSDYIESITYYTLGNVDQNVIINLEKDNNN